MKIDKRHKIFLFAIVLSLLTYFIFFGQFLKSDYYFWSNDGQTSDAQTKHIPARVYFYEKIVQEHSFPFWTEKMYSGFPIYADPENAYLNPVNDASILIFGPWLSYKFLHILEYLIGSLSLFFLLRRKGIGIWGYAAANAIFYFNTFFINHQVHFNMIMSLYLLPTAILLTDLFIEKRKLSLIFFQSLVLTNAILWGHMQSVVLLGMGIFLYLAVFSFKKMRLATFFFYLVTVIFLAIVITLPQIVPTYELLAQSTRDSGTDYLKGSLSPRMAIFSFVPYLFGGYTNFIGEEIKNGFGYGEIYTYVGISSMILSVLTLLFLKKTREVILSFVFIWVFLIFAFMDSNKIFPDNTPVITLFRFWVRTAVLSSFGIALLVGIFIEKINEISYKDIRKNIFFVLVPLAYIWILIKMESGGIVKEINPYVSFQYIRNYPYFFALWMIVLVLAIVLTLFVILKKWRPDILPKILTVIKIVFVVIVFFDLIYFSKDVLASRLHNISNFKIASIPKELENKRSILNSRSVAGMESLYYKNWSPLGSSQLKSKEYVNYCNRFDFKLRGVSLSSDLLPMEYQKLKEIGIASILTPNGITNLNNNKLDLIKNDLKGDYLKKKEGHLILEVDNPEDMVVSTYLRYDSGWKVTIDGEKTEIVKNDIFFDFPLEKGQHLIEIRYYPKTFYVAIISSLIAGTAIWLILYFFKRNIKKCFLDN
ncbi:MAG: hypothetical protein ACD_11C00019G0003 [uncultured bacterium]|nr:MAG: hypothetical protein ACD_11C00019G0003 [uncultured bacterium]HBR71900.1 hypothetical protein [Candidatus Moranbacteria bacterium]